MNRFALKSARAFTLTELLVVLAIVAILMGIALPAFLSMSASQERTSSESRLGAAMLVARDAAILGGEGADVGAVFTYDLGGPMRIVACRKTGEFTDTASRESFEIFVPLDTVEPVTLPRGWTVRGYAPAGLMTPVGSTAWYTDSGSPYPRGIAAWVFPETDFYNHTLNNDGAHRQTFMVRFEGGTGKLVGATTNSALVLLPRPTNNAARNTGAAGDRLRSDITDDLRALAVGLLNDPTVPYTVKKDLVGPDSSDMVLTRPVQTLALAEESDLANVLGARLDRNSECLYLAADADVTAGLTLTPQMVNDGSGAPLTGEVISRAIESFDPPTGTGTTRKPEQDVRLFSIDRYYGTLQIMPVTIVTP